MLGREVGGVAGRFALSQGEGARDLGGSWITRRCTRNGGLFKRLLHSSAHLSCIRVVCANRSQISSGTRAKFVTFECLLPLKGRIPEDACV